MKIVNIPNCDSKIRDKIDRLVVKQLGDATDKSLENGYVFLDTKSNTIFGYCLLVPDGKQIKVDWIYAKKGYGTDFLSRIERAIFKKYDRIVLNVSIDPNESKQTVMRRIYFYIKNNYRMYDIKFRKKYGPLMMMEKLK